MSLRKMIESRLVEIHAILHRPRGLIRPLTDPISSAADASVYRRGPVETNEEEKTKWRARPGAKTCT